MSVQVCAEREREREREREAFDWYIYKSCIGIKVMTSSPLGFADRSPQIAVKKRGWGGVAH